MLGIELRALGILSKFSATGHISSMAKDGSLSVFPLDCQHLWQAHAQADLTFHQGVLVRGG